jgi:Ca-activated chloride channel family protein
MRDEPAVLKAAHGAPMVFEGVDAQGRLRGLLFELVVEQRYRNPRADAVEVVYTFPLPLDAVLLDVDVTIGDRRLQAAVAERRAAEDRYEAAIAAGDGALMLERAGDGLCTLNLGNLPGGERATIRFRSAQLLRFAHGSVRLAIPTVIAPRYGDPAAAGLAPHQVPVTELAASYPFALAVDVEGDVARGRIASPSHAVDVARTRDGVRVTLAPGAVLDRDFVLNVDGLEGCSPATVARDGERVVALASFCAAVPVDAAPLPIALRLLVDCSGSMNGDSIEAARRALHRVLAHLEPDDRFSLTRFGSTVRHETRGLVHADDAAVRAGADALARMQADLGGTEMERALRAVFALGVPGEAGDLLAVTDGEVWNAAGLVEAALAARQRVFVVGIGSAPAEGVLRRLAEASGGACEFVAPREDVEGAIVRMFARMRAPRVARADVHWPATPAWSVPLPAALFGGETIHAFAAFDAPVTGKATLTLVPSGEGSPLQAVATLDGVASGDDTLARVAAAQRLPHVTDDERLALALHYRLLTDRTSFVVVDERMAHEKAKGMPVLATVPQMHAAGWHGLGSVDACMQIDFDALDVGADRSPARRSHDLHFKATNCRVLASIEPDGIDALLADGLPEAWRPLLQALVDEGFDPAAIVQALLSALARRLLAADPALPRHVARQLRQWERAPVAAPLRDRLEALLQAGVPEAAVTNAWLRRRATPAPVF